MRISLAFIAVFAAGASLSAPALSKAEPAGTWIVREIGGRPAVTEAQTTLRLGEGAVTGWGGCNIYSGLGRIAGGDVSVGMLAMTKMGCAPDVLEQEATFASTLPRSVRYEIDTVGAMRMYDAQGRLTMRLTRAR